jgi:hypothetical protein
VLGNLVLVELADLPGIIIGDSMGDSYVQVASVNLPTSTYNQQVYYATASSTGLDTITISGIGNFPEIVVHEMSAQFSGDFSTGSGVSANAGVASYNPGQNNFVLAVAGCANGGTSCDVASVTAGLGYTLIGEHPAPILADEGAILSQATTSPFSLGNQQNWAEISLSFTISNVSNIAEFPYGFLVLMGVALPVPWY